MRVAIRVDATAQIGTGHLIRTLTLADRLAAAGARVRFVTRSLPPHLGALVRSRHELAELTEAGEEARGGDLPHSHWLPATQEVDAGQTLAALQGETWQWVVVDHYALDARWQNALRRTGSRLLAIDDLADRNHDCDVLLDQNLYPDPARRYAGRVPATTQQLIGPGYALLREEFSRMREGRRPRGGPVQRVMVFLGGMDAENYTSRALDGLEQAGLGPLAGDVVVGGQHPARHEIEAKCRRAGLVCHGQTGRMAEFMGSADLAIGATGSASWERCCLALPTIGVAIAANQKAIAEGLAAVGAIIQVEPDAGRMEAGIAKAAQILATDPARRQAMAAAAAALVDGQGARRVVAAMANLK